MSPDPLWLFHALPQSFQVGLWIGIAVLVVLAGIGVYLALFGKGESEKDLSAFERRRYIFDSKAEADLFHMLMEMYGDRYHVFPQMAYSHIVQAKKNLPYRERFRYWNMINRKSADFVLCDKSEVVPRVVIELDGPTHQLEERKERDGFVDELMQRTGLPIRHLKLHEGTNRETVKSEVDRALTPSQ